MSTAANARPALMPWKDPVQATIPEIREGSMSAVYYGQRRSGDFYDFVRVNPQRVLFGLFDVAGLLQQTRKIVLALQQQFRESGTLLFQPVAANESESMLELWLHINSAVMKSASGVHPCPAFMACYNEALGTICYVNAGHTPGLVRDRSQSQELKATALPLGLFSHSVPDSSVLALQPGNALLIVSKGVVEAKHNGEEYGIERVSQYLQHAAFETAHQTCVGILSKVQQFMGTAPTHNDVTALALVRSN
jgi:phosphoserine phosphatase RsbU/P